MKLKDLSRIADLSNELDTLNDMLRRVDAWNVTFDGLKVDIGYRIAARLGAAAKIKDQRNKIVFDLRKLGVDFEEQGLDA
jgi:hypothetical protein